MKIRRFETGDQEKIKEFVISSMKEVCIYCTKYSDADLNDVENAYIEQDGEFLVVEEDRKIFGTVGVFRINKDFAQLRRWYLHPSLRGKGIGKQLLERIIIFCEAKKYKGIITISEVELEKALVVYKKAGFEVFKKTKEVNYLVKELGENKITNEMLEEFTKTKWNIEWKNGKWTLTKITSK